MLSTTKAHVMNENPSAITYQPNTTYSSDIETAEELGIVGFAKVIARQKLFRSTIPLTVRRGAAATVNTYFTIPS